MNPARTVTLTSKRKRWAVGNFKFLIIGGLIAVSKASRPCHVAAGIGKSTYIIYGVQLTCMQAKSLLGMMDSCRFASIAERLNKVRGNNNIGYRSFYRIHDLSRSIRRSCRLLPSNYTD